jgi:hypothetical protein
MTAIQPKPTTQDLLHQRWIVAGPGEKYCICQQEYTSCEDMAILTEKDRYEVVGCSEWMRAEKKVFEYIVSIHNTNLEAKAGHP